MEFHLGRVLWRRVLSRPIYKSLMLQEWQFRSNHFHKINFFALKLWVQWVLHSSRLRRAACYTLSSESLPALLGSWGVHDFLWIFCKLIQFFINFWWFEFIYNSVRGFRLGRGVHFIILKCSAVLVYYWNAIFSHLKTVLNKFWMILKLGFGQWEFLHRA